MLIDFLVLIIRFINYHLSSHALDYKLAIIHFSARKIIANRVLLY